MKHLATIQIEFLKEATKWNELSLNVQQQYLKNHPKSKRRLTAKFEKMKNPIEVLHFTTLENANKIKEEGFKPEFIGHGYEKQNLGKGVYFYPDEVFTGKRFLKEYAFVLANKLGKDKDKFAIIHAIIDKDKSISSDKYEDGLAVRPEDISHIKINRIEPIDRFDIQKIY